MSSAKLITALVLAFSLLASLSAFAAEKPAAVNLMNAGVKLACEGSSSADDLRLLVEGGVAVKACGTCLDYYHLTDKLEVGEVGTMPAAVAALVTDDVLTVG